MLPSVLDWLLELPVETLLPLELVICPLEVGECSGEAEGGELTETMYGEIGFVPAPQRGGLDISWFPTPHPNPHLCSSFGLLSQN